MSELRQGRLVVATPLLGDPNFSRAVVLLIEHRSTGAAGVILNRPTDLALSDHLPELVGLGRRAEPSVLFLGGPVARESVMAMGRPIANAVAVDEAVVDDVALIDLSRDGHDGAALEEVRLFGGYAGWGGGQLESEIAEGAWWVFDGSKNDVFSSDPTRLWHDVVRRQPGRVKLFADYPVDVARN